MGRSQYALYPISELSSSSEAGSSRNQALKRVAEPQNGQQAKVEQMPEAQKAAPQLQGDQKAQKY
jgi:hypothetical protein